MSMPAVDWSDLSWRTPGAAKYRSVIVAGDWAPIRELGEMMLQDPIGVYGGTLDVLRSANCRIVNLESPLGGTVPRLKSGPNLRGKSEHLRCLDVPGFTAVTLGNNHALDYGADGLERTMALLDERGIGHVGAGMDLAEAARPLVLDIGGITLGIVNFTEGHDLIAAAPDAPGVFGWDIELVLDKVKKLKKHCDLVLAIPHAGAEYVPFPPGYIRQAYRRIAAAGADAVIAHHPHVPQGLEFANGVPIFYSLGNYLFHQPVRQYYRKIGFMVELELEKNGRLAGFRLHPHHLTDRGATALEGSDRDEFSDLMRKLSSPLPEHGDEAWNAVLKERWHRNYVSDSLWGPLETLEKDPRVGAMKLLNKFTTPCHREFYIDVTKRVASGTIDDAPDELYLMAKAYNDRSLVPASK